MTKKRFTMYQNTIYDNGNILSPFNCMKVMNTLHNENEQLKSSIYDIQTGTYINARNTIKELKKVNEQLKQAYNDAKADAEKKEQILHDVMKTDILIQDIMKEEKND